MNPISKYNHVSGQDYIFVTNFRLAPYVPRSFQLRNRLEQKKKFIYIHEKNKIVVKFLSVLPDLIKNVKHAK